MKIKSLFAALLLLVIFACEDDDPKTAMKEIKSSLKQITSFSLPGAEKVEFSATKDTIKIQIPSDFDLSAATPKVAHNAAKIVPAVGAKVDLNTTKKYNLTAEDGSQHSYILWVKQTAPKSDANRITELKLKGVEDKLYEVVLSTTSDTIKIKVLDAANASLLEAATPVIKISDKASTTYTETKLNLHNKQSTITVKAESGKARNYILKGYVGAKSETKEGDKGEEVIEEEKNNPPKSTDNKLLSFNISNFEAGVAEISLDHQANTITIKILDYANNAKAETAIPVVELAEKATTNFISKETNLRELESIAVTSEAGEVRNYEIILKLAEEPARAEDTDNKISQFNITNFEEGVAEIAIDHDANTITITILEYANNSKATAAIPTITIAETATTTFENSVEVNLNTLGSIAVTSQAGEERVYEVIVNLADEPVATASILGKLITKEQYEALFKDRYGSENHPEAASGDLYSYAALEAAIEELSNKELKYVKGNAGAEGLVLFKDGKVAAEQQHANNYEDDRITWVDQRAADFSKFLNSGDEATDKIELAAFLASISYLTAEEAGASYKKPLYKKIDRTNGGAWNTGFSIYKNVEGVSDLLAAGKYYQRGPLNLRGYINYAELSMLIYEDIKPLLENPDLISNETTDGKLTFMSAIYLWMYHHPLNKKAVDTGHNAIVQDKDYAKSTKIMDSIEGQPACGFAWARGETLRVFYKALFGENLPEDVNTTCE